jgi:heme transport system ATP-binding protein
MINIENLAYSINNKQLLNEISFDVHSGDVLTILGPNGAGKTTLLKSLSGDIKPQSGNVKITNKNMDEFNVNQLAKIRSVVEQSNNIVFPFTVDDIVSFGRYPINKGYITPEDRETIHETMDLFEIESLSDRIYNTLSGGEQQRVQLARAIVQLINTDSEDQFRFLLLDEPISSMDICHQHRSLSILQKLSEQGISIITILHDINLAINYSSKVVLMSQGKMIKAGTVEETCDPKTLESIFEISMDVIEHPKKNNPLFVPYIQ